MDAQSLSGLQLFAVPWTVAYQASLSMGFSKQEYLSGLPFPPARGLPDPGIERMSLVSPALAGGFLTPVPAGKPHPMSLLHGKKLMPSLC